VEFWQRNNELHPSMEQGANSNPLCESSGEDAELKPFWIVRRVLTCRIDMNQFA